MAKGTPQCESVDENGACTNRSVYCSPIRMCPKHYQRWKRNGDPAVAQVVVHHWPENLLRRLVFHPPSDLPTGCITYEGVRDRQGYGKLKVPGSRNSRLAHRMCYELIRGPIPDGMELDHLCSNQPCVNPGHLEPVTHLENMQRYHRKRRGE